MSKDALINGMVLITAPAILAIGTRIAAADPLYPWQRGGQMQGRAAMINGVHDHHPVEVTT